MKISEDLNFSQNFGKNLEFGHIKKNPHFCQHFRKNVEFSNNKKLKNVDFSQFSENLEFCQIFQKFAILVKKFQQISNSDKMPK